MNDSLRHTLSKVPEVTLIFWIIKIVATTLGETGGDAVSMSLNLGYLVGTAIFAVIFIVAVTAQILAKQFHPMVYWITIVATTTVGTTLADFVDRSLGIGYVGGSSLLFAAVLAMLALWRFSLGSIAVDHITSPKAEMFYWATIMFSQTLGTALGDFAADNGGLGFGGGVLVFAGALVVVALLYYFTKLPRTLLFWAAFILTRPLGATAGDLLDKPHAQGGMAIDRFTASGVLAALIVLGVLFLPQRAGRHPGAGATSA
jgi:uncharacterized membrane-anchored protein